ncbi:alpha-(1,3)-fucosyltransferase C-like [Arctopsyche grandis]|uniref:alpha-(1,3)-fucosyltransferase C-like n=1 Tax=Arctopsyche grandis TaxID=121162 RepID=UPI00406DA16C
MLYSIQLKDVRNSETNQEYSVTKKILLWNPVFGHLDYNFGSGIEPFYNHGCKIKNCYITHSRKWLSFDQFDAVVFNGAEYPAKTKNFPNVRTESQLYVYLSMESPANRKVTSSLNGIFNLTMTYRLDSDIPLVYFYVYDFDGNAVAPSQDPDWINPNEIEVNTTEFISIFKKKSKTVTWFSSNCLSKSHREKRIKELQKHIKVDVYGKCGTFKCPRTNETVCFEKMKNDYFFYLSYENSLCNDYLTEKVRNPLIYDTIPVILGGSNLTKFIPPGSYIDASSMSTIDLANKLKYLMDHPEEYAKYFWWRKFYTIEPVLKKTKFDAFCRLCERLHAKITKPKIYDNLLEWWHGPKAKPMCK